MSYVSNSTGSNAANNTTCATAALSVTAGRTLVVVFTSQDEFSGQTHTVTDTAGNTYGSAVVSAGASGEIARLWVVHNCLGNANNVVTVTANVNQRFKFATQVQLDTGGTGTTDDSDSLSASGTADATTPSMTASGAGTIVYGTTSTNDRTWTANTNFLEAQDTGTGHSVGYRDIESGGSYTAGAQASSSSNISVVAVIVANAAGGGTTRGIPFGTRGTAFNGGRPLTGILRLVGGLILPPPAWSMRDLRKKVA